MFFYPCYKFPSAEPMQGGRVAGNCQAEKKAEEEREAEAKRDLMA
jgi:hypothetical protein